MRQCFGVFATISGPSPVPGWGGRGSNPRLADYESAALTN